MGVPQGTAVSLFLANVATGSLDRELETMPISFARYADDLLIWSTEYEAVSRAASRVQIWADQIGVPINPEKSLGIRLLVPSAALPRAEMSSTDSTVFLSHELGIDRTVPAKKAIRAIRHRVLRYIYDNLIREPLAGTQDMSRLTETDRDYATLMWQLRRYLYGSHSEREVRAFEHGSIPRVRFSGAVARYPYTDDDGPLEELDRWIRLQVWLALRKRESLLAPMVAHSPAPWGYSRTQLSKAWVRSTRTGARVDLRLPSAARMARVVRRAVNVHGSFVAEVENVYG
jgi:hypothetical protein